MSIRTILVDLDTTPANSARTAIAIALAQRFDAHLTGLAPVTTAALQNLQTAAALDGYVGGISATLLGRADDLAQDFRLKCDAAGITSCHALADHAAVADSLLRQTQCADLVVISQPDPSLPGYRQRLESVEELLLACARPVLLIPYTHLDPLRVRRVLVTWDGSRESVRAMTDALPWLREAEHVTLVHWRQTPDAVPPAPGLAAVQQWLARHDVRAEVRDEITPLAVGEALLNAASDHAADLVVMGAYGHARWAERLFGGVSRTLLSSMTVPVLMSH